ncbi:hypothetical protein CY35_14G050500 [Sphagnum magellanicum]|nr:hypothetical protein CY35_14G050500 [Sphagnum magellanicum]
MDKTVMYKTKEQPKVSNCHLVNVIDKVVLGCSFFWRQRNLNEHLRTALSTLSSNLYSSDDT